MHSTMNPKPTDDPHDFTVVAPDVAMMAPTDEELSKLARSVRHPENSQARTGADLPAGPTVPPVDTTFRPAAVGDIQVPGRRRTMGGRTARSITTALLLAACTGAIAIAWQSYGGAAEQMIARWAPQRLLASLLPLENPALPTQPTPPAVEANAANPSPPQSGSPAPSALDGVASAVQSAPSLGSMTNDLASVRQEVEQLRASIEELKANQQQMSRDIAKFFEAKASEAKPSQSRASEVRASEPNLRPKLSAQPWRAAAAPARKPLPPLPPPQAAAYPTLPPPAAPYVPRQAEPPPPTTAETLADPELASVPRPPMPVR